MVSAFALSALSSGRACRVGFYDEIDISINKLQKLEDAQIEQMLTGAKKQNCTNVLRSHRVKNGSALQVAGK